MTLRRALAPLTRITITTQLLLWFLIISLIPCVVLTAIISLQCQPIPEKNGAPGTAGDRRRQGDTARDFHSRAPRRPEHGQPVHHACRLITAARRGTAERSRRFTAYLESSSEDSPVYGKFRRIVRLFQRLPVRHGWIGPLPAQARPRSGIKPPDRSAQGQRAGRSVRPGSHVAANGSLGLPDVRRAKRAGGVHCQSGLQHPGTDHRVRGLELGNQQVFRVLKDYSGLGETGEAMVAMRHGEDEFIYVAPPRNSDETALKLPREGP